MTIAFRTGNERDQSCYACGRVVRHVENEIVGRRFWDPIRHDAPSCGMTCIGGGYKPRQPHHGGSRPSCACAATKTGQSPGA